MKSPNHDRPVARVPARKYPQHTPEDPVGVPIPTKPGASTQARCKTCGENRKALTFAIKLR